MSTYTPEAAPMVARTVPNGAAPGARVATGAPAAPALPAAVPRGTGDPVLVVSNLRKAFAGRAVVDDVSFEAAAGEIFALLGQNGAGKTTTIKMCSGLLSPDAGSVRINGLDPQRGGAASAQLGALLEGNRNLYWRMTPLENLRYFGVLKGMPIAAATAQGRELLHRFGLVDKIDQQVQKLSRGMMQRLAIAVAMLNRPRVLFLDEPTLGLDVGSVAQMLDMLRVLAAEGTTIILTTHQLDVAEALSDRVAIIHRGRIIKIARTEALKREFALSGYEIRLEGALADDVRHRVERDFGAVVNDHAIHLPGEADLLYGVLESIRPVPVEYVRRCRSDLTSIFLRLTGEHADA